MTREEYYDLTEELRMVYWSHEWFDGWEGNVTPMPDDHRIRVIDCVTKLLERLNGFEPNSGRH
jgi:hypothetical protein